MKLSFHGGAREVTGACYLLETASARILIDCGLFQGSRELDDLNYEPFGFDPASIDALVVSHAHLDHIGRIPKLVNEGFTGAIYSTAPTKDLSRVVLEDAMSLAERNGRSSYTAEDLDRAFQLWKDVSYGKTVEANGVKIRLDNAGHILGSAFIEIWAEEKHFWFTGDLGNIPSTLLPPPIAVKDAEYLIIESTYGNRTHKPEQERELILERAVEDTAARQGTLMIPAFATERTQDILFILNEMLHFRRIPEIPVFVDAPLAIRVTGVYEDYLADYKPEIRQLFKEHPNLFKFKKLTFTETVEESKAINGMPPPKVIIAGSGMMTGGRILHHLKRYLPDTKSILLIVGFQSAGSLGRRLIDGDRLVKIMGEQVPVEAEIRQAFGFSAHADNPQLFDFVSSTRHTLKKVFVVHGEEASALHLTNEIRDRLGLYAEAPQLHQEFEI